MVSEIEESDHLLCLSLEAGRDDGVVVGAPVCDCQILIGSTRNASKSPCCSLRFNS